MSLTDEQKKQLKEWGVDPKSINEYKHYTKSMMIINTVMSFFLGMLLFGAVIFLGLTNGFVTDGTCNDMVINATNQSFINGSMYGYNTALYSILSETGKCEQPLPITFQNETYNLFMVECLNLNTPQEAQK